LRDSHAQKPFASSQETRSAGCLGPLSVKHWSLTTLREKLVKIGAKVVAHSRYVIFQMAEVAIQKRLFKTILRRISQLAPLAPVPI
jgi:hypothetical protein